MDEIKENFLEIDPKDASVFIYEKVPIMQSDNTIVKNDISIDQFNRS